MTAQPLLGGRRTVSVTLGFRFGVRRLGVLIRFRRLSRLSALGRCVRSVPCARGNVRRRFARDVAFWNRWPRQDEHTEPDEPEWPKVPKPFDFEPAEIVDEENRTEPNEGPAPPPRERESRRLRKRSSRFYEEVVLLRGPVGVDHPIELDEGDHDAEKGGVIGELDGAREQNKQQYSFTGLTKINVPGSRKQRKP